MKYMAVGLAALVLAGPSGLHAQNRVPTNLPSQVTLRAVLVDLTDGQFLGIRSSMNPPAGVPAAVYRWNQAQREYDRSIDLAMLRELGLPAVDSAEFEFASDTSAATRYQLRATIEQLRIDFAREAWVTVRWDLYDAVRGKLVGSFRSKGYARTAPGVGTWRPLTVITLAFDVAIEELLAQDSFVSVLGETPSS